MLQSQEKSSDVVSDDLLRIGRLSTLTGVSIDTIRYYERRGVVPRATRTQSNYRLFPPDTVERLSFVRRLQEVGFTLEEIIDALRAHDAGGVSCDSERWRLESVRERIEGQIRELGAVRDQLDTLLEACRAGCCEFVEAT